MGQAGPYLRTSEYGPGGAGYTFWCPGCEEVHMFITQRGEYRPQGPVWSFNGDVEKPTFSPSLIIWSGHYAPGHEEGSPCWCTFNQDLIEKGEEPSKFKCGICHLIMTDGIIQYCADSTHHLSGQSVHVPILPSHLQDEEDKDA